MNKIFKPFIALFKAIYKIIDKIIVTPISRIVYKLRDIFKNNSSRLEKILNRPNILIYVSLICAVAIFLLVDSKVIDLTEREAEIISNQKVNAIFNEEAYIVDGIPEQVDITLIGSRSTVYMATQLGNHEVTLDLSGYGVGTYKVPLKYNHNINSVDYKLDPSTVTVKISEKVSKVVTLGYNMLNENKLDSKLSISNVVLDNNEIIIKSSQEMLDKVAVVKALIDASNITLTDAGEMTLDSIPLVAYDKDGNRLTTVETVPSKVTATITVEAYHDDKIVKVVTKGNMASGKAIASITQTVPSVTIYGEKSVVDSIAYVEAVVNIDKLDADKNISVDLVKPSGVRYMSTTKTDVSIKVGTETNRTIEGVVVEAENLASNLAVQAASADDKQINVIVKGVDTVINDNELASKIKATVDLTGLKPGTHTVPVKITVSDERVIAQAEKTEITVKISESSK